jgi:hypothetical protein
MQSFLILETYTGSIWVCDPNTCTKVWIKTWDEFTAQVHLRDIDRYFGGTADSTLHHTDEVVNDIPGFWGQIWSNCRDVDEFNDVGTGGGGGGGTPAPKQFDIVLAGKATAP